MTPYYEDDDNDPKKPRPVLVSKKRQGADERSEARKGDRDHRHVNVRC